MTNEYNAKLIAEIYSTDSVEKAAQVAEEMTAIKDSIFPAQIYEAYKKFKGTTMDHYFISYLAQFKTPEADKILLKHALEVDDEADLHMMLSRLISLSFFDETVVENVSKYLKKELEDLEMDEYIIEEYCTYLKEANQLKQLAENLQTAFESDKSSASAKKVILKNLLRISPSHYLNYYLSNYDHIKERRCEIIFATEVATWQNGVIPKLHKHIIEHGSSTAKKIIEDAIKTKETQQDQAKAKTEKIVGVRYKNSEIVSQIVEQRQKINTQAGMMFGHHLFRSTEALINQSNSANSSEEFVSSMIDLRECIGDFDKTIISLDYSLDEMQKHNPDIQETTGQINKFEVYLSINKVDCSHALVTLRQLGGMLSKIAHPKQKAGLIEKLQELSIYKLYENENWSELHKSVLNIYLTLLKKLSDSLKSERLQD